MTSKKYCIFCGKNPDDKNKEHPLPEWLLAFTGDPNRKVVVHHDRLNNKSYEWAFDQFVFPACVSCNSAYSDLENKAKTIIASLNNAEVILAEDYLLLFDWMDKVRIGLWLGILTLEKGFDIFRPKFFINDRVGKKDRAMHIYRFPDEKNGLTPFGSDSYGFKCSPSVFGLRINQTFIYNVSSDAIFARNLGCYFPKTKQYNVETGQLLMDNFKLGTVNFNKIKPNFKASVSIFQSILDTGMDRSGPSYLRPKVSYPFVIRNGQLRKVGLNEGISFEVANETESCYLAQLAAQIYDEQIKMVCNGNYVGSIERLRSWQLSQLVVKVDNKAMIEHHLDKLRSLFPEVIAKDFRFKFPRLS